ncbi:MAG TPA: hypothetical protein VG734_27390 [Lacunisphaera sp.]|nr:hypothetical protein [Lacunisphaera sp.]
MEFLLVGSAEGTAHLADSLGDFLDRVSVLWGLPLGQKVRVDLRKCEPPWQQGRLELAQAPDLPLDPRQVLALRIGTIEFSSRQIVAWALG